MFVLAVQTSAIVPSLMLLWYFQSRDVYPEPPKVVWVTFILGVLSTIPVLLTVLPLNLVLNELGLDGVYLRGFADSFLLAAVPEEFFKYLVLVLYTSRCKAFDEPMDGVVYGVAASLGFATLENILYVSEGGLGVAAMRAVTAVPGHAMMGAVMGYYVGQAKFAPASRKSPLAFKALAVPIFLHTLYDFPLVTMQSAGEMNLVIGQGETAVLALLTLGILIFEWVLAVKLTKGLRQEQLIAAGIVQRKPGFLFGLILLILGVILSGIGGLVCLAAALSLLLGQIPPADVTALLIGAAVAGLLPLAVGLFFFVKGITILNGRQPRDFSFGS